MPKIRILLLDDHTLFRDGLSRLLDSEPDFEIAANCSSVPEPATMIAVDFFRAAARWFESDGTRLGAICWSAHDGFDLRRDTVQTCRCGGREFVGGVGENRCTHASSTLYQTGKMTFPSAVSRAVSPFSSRWGQFFEKNAGLRITMPKREFANP